MKVVRGVIGAFSTGALLATGLTLATGSGIVASAAPAIFHPPRVPVSWPQPGTPGVPGAQNAFVRNTWAASNWSGYAETGTFTGVTGTWTVPSVAASSSATYSSAWIGVDGFNNSNLIQTGTEEDYYNGAAHYNAWWEILPAAETALPGSYAVAPGDRMTASIYETSSTVSSGGGGGRFGRGGGGSSEHVWVITIGDTTRSWSFSSSQAYNGPGSSAEWVMEAPEVGGRIATLAHYTVSPPSGTGDFDNAGVLNSIVASGGTPTYSSAGLNYQNDSGVMIQNNVQVSTPGNPDTPLTAFNAAYGSAVPPTPTG